MITKGERTELKSMVRQQFKVLRAEVIQRRAEMMVEVEAAIGERYRSHDEQFAEAGRIIRDIVHKANIDAVDALSNAKVPIIWYRGESGSVVSVSLPQLDTRDRYNEKATAEAQIEAMVKGALLALDRQEADLVRTLTIGALESAEAKAFLAGIPTVGELVSIARLRELEEQV